MDVVVIDAPCTGSGVWRRRPDAKWRLSPQMLEARLKEQAEVLEEGAPLVKPGGRLAYITCSVLPPENRDQVEAFLTRHPEFKLIPSRQLWEEALAGDAASSLCRRLGRHPADDALEPRHRRLLRGSVAVRALMRSRDGGLGNRLVKKVGAATPLALEINKQVAEMTRALKAGAESAVGASQLAKARRGRKTQ